MALGDESGQEVGSSQLQVVRRELSEESVATWVKLNLAVAWIGELWAVGLTSSFPLAREHPRDLLIWGLDLMVTF